MSLNLTGTIGNVLDTLRGLISADGVELEFFEYSTAIGKVSLGKVLDKWVGYSKEDPNGSYQEFIVTDDAGVATYAAAILTLVSQPTTGDSLTVGNKVYAFVASDATGDQINIGVSTAATAINISAKVNIDTVGALSTATSSLNVVSLIANSAGTNSIALESDGTRITKSAFSGGIVELATIMPPIRRPTHVLMGELYYTIEAAPSQPLETNDAIRYWLIRCAHTGWPSPQ